MSSLPGSVCSRWKIPGNLGLESKEPEVKKNKSDSVHLERAEAGPSNLCESVGDNVTYHAQGTFKSGYFNLPWHWAWRVWSFCLPTGFGLFFPRENNNRKRAWPLPVL
jgi:hypothetical protein